MVIRMACLTLAGQNPVQVGTEAFSALSPGCPAQDQVHVTEGSVGP